VLCIQILAAAGSNTLHSCCFRPAAATAGSGEVAPGVSLFFAPGLSLQSDRSAARSAVDADSATDESASEQYNGSSPEAVQLLAAAVPMYCPPLLLALLFKGLSESCRDSKDLPVCSGTNPRRNSSSVMQLLQQLFHRVPRAKRES
jgi:hypothetical protein